MKQTNCVNQALAYAFLLKTDFYLETAIHHCNLFQDLFAKFHQDLNLPIPTTSLLYYLNSPLIIFNDSLDKKGFQIMTIHLQNYTNDSVFISIFRYIIDGILSSDTFLKNKGKITLVLDLNKVPNSHSRIRSILNYIEFYMPLTINIALIVNSPWYTKYIPDLIIPSCSNHGRFKSLVIVVDDLKEFIHEHDLMKEYGGELDFNWDKYKRDLLIKDKNIDQLVVEEILGKILGNEMKDVEL